MLATIHHRVQRLLVRHGLKPADDATAPADQLAQESPVLAGIVGASVQGRVALGSSAGARVQRLGAPRDTEAVTSRGARQAHLEGFDCTPTCGGQRTIGRGWASVPLRLAHTLRAGPAAAAERRPHRAGVEASVARRHARANVRAAGVVGASRGDDAAAGDEPADLPWSVGCTRPLARPCGRVRARGGRAHVSTAPLAAGPEAWKAKSGSRAWNWATLMHRAFDHPIECRPRRRGDRTDPGHASVSSAARTGDQRRRTATQLG